MSNNICTLIDSALRGEATPGHVVTIYWDTQDPSNSGPAYRVRDNDGREESGALEFNGWSDDEQTEGYELVHYFGRNDEYAGPDQDGIYPILVAA